MSDIIHTRAEDYEKDYGIKLPFDNSIGMDAFRDIDQAPVLQDVDDDFKRLNCYKSNLSLMRSGVSVPMTDAHQAELKRCKKDIFYFLINYGRIISLDDGEINFALFQYQKNMIKLMDENRFVVNLLPRQMGKALDGETDILTKNGFVKMKDIKIGDYVYNAKGKLVKVIATTGAQFNRKCYELEFSNGEKIVADENHDWKFTDKSMNKILIRNTTEMINRHEINKKQKQSISIDHCDMIDFEHKDVDIAPYELGVWLGDGFSGTSKMTCHKDDYYEYKKIINISDFTIRKNQPNCVDFRFNDFDIKTLDRMNLKNNKHIPKNYIYNSKEVRLELIRGLMDTDGSIEKNGVCRFYQSDKNIIDDFRFILSTLGIKSTLGTIEFDNYKTAYTVHFVCNDFDIVKLPRKLERQYLNKNHVKNKRLYIKNYREVESRPVYCITVDDDDHLFLAGRSLIPTHNCSEKNTLIKVRNKRTGEVKEMTMQEFHELAKRKREA